MEYNSKKLDRKEFEAKVRELIDDFVKWAMVEFDLSKDDAENFCLKITCEFTNNRSSGDSPDKYRKDIAFRIAYLEYARLVNKANTELDKAAVA